MATRKDLDALLLDKISDALTLQQKKNRIGNLLYAMAYRDKSIRNRGSDKKPEWVPVESSANGEEIRSKKP